MFEGKEGAELEREFDAIDAEDLTGMGLTNVLALSKIGGLDPKRIEDAERRLITNLRTTTTIDRASDYPVAWHIATTLASPPQFNEFGIREVAERIERFVFDEAHAENDPWELKSVLQTLKD